MVPGPPHPPGSARKKIVPCPERPKDNLELLGGTERRDGSTGYCASEVCYPCWSLSKCILWSGVRAL